MELPAAPLLTMSTMAHQWNIGVSLNRGPKFESVFCLKKT